MLYSNYQVNFPIDNIFDQKPTLSPAPAHAWPLHHHPSLQKCEVRAGSAPEALPADNSHPAPPPRAGGVQNSNLNHLCPVTITMKSRWLSKAKVLLAPHQLLCTGLTKISVTIQRPKGYLFIKYLL